MKRRSTRNYQKGLKRESNVLRSDPACYHQVFRFYSTKYHKVNIYDISALLINADCRSIIDFEIYIE